MTGTLDQTAQRIADKGREALVDRLRPAFEEAVAAHADVLELDADKLERMVQHAADRADGLQWRRALAAVATEELGIGLGEALGHPAVARAQTIVGAPSYEESLAAITEPRPAGADGAGATDPVDTGGSADSGDPADVGEAAGTGESADGEAADGEAAEGGEQTGTGTGNAAERAEAADGGFPILVGVVHLDGLPKLDGEGELELRFSDRGLDVVRQRGGATLAHFAWREIHGVEVRAGRGRMLRRGGARTRLILSATGRHARFEAPGADPKELEERLAPALANIRGRT
jgi:hypothetical protein